MKSIFLKCVIDIFLETNYYNYRYYDYKKFEKIELLYKKMSIELYNTFYTHEIQCYIIKDKMSLDYNVIKKYYSDKIYDDMYRAYDTECISKIVNRIQGYLFHTIKIDKIDRIEFMNILNKDTNNYKKDFIIKQEINRANILWSKKKYKEAVILFSKNFDNLKKNEVMKLNYAKRKILQ